MENERLAVVETEMSHLRNDVKEIKSDVKALLGFKWKVIGFAICAAFLASTLVELVRH